MSIFAQQPVCHAQTMNGFAIAYYPIIEIGELQPILFDNRGRQFYVTAWPDDVVYREIPVGRMYDASGYEPYSAIETIKAEMPARLKHFIEFIEGGSV